jgi:hypothetical protein
LEKYAQAIRDKFEWNVMVPHYLESVTLFRSI